MEREEGLVEMCVRAYFMGSVGWERGIGFSKSDRRGAEQFWGIC